MQPSKKIKTLRVLAAGFFAVLALVNSQDAFAKQPSKADLRTARVLAKRCHVSAQLESRDSRDFVQLENALSFNKRFVNQSTSQIGDPAICNANNMETRQAYANKRMARNSCSATAAVTICHAS